jgi:glycosidase
MNYVRIFAIALFVGLASLAAAQSDEIYNDDPLQKHPLGYEEPEFVYRDASGGTVDQARVEPPFWWVGMQERTVELVLYDENIRDFNPQVDYPGVAVQAVTRLDNPNYLFVMLDIGRGTAAGQFPIQLVDDKGAIQKMYPYELKERKRNAAQVQGLDASDFIYLIMPDRFANGDPGNDSVEGMAQQGINRDKIFFRHGGDLIGIMEHLDYLESLGVTALWLNPVMENDQPSESYHGYAVTDHYRIDRRLGTNEQYAQLVRLAHERGIKVVMDVIFNHVGDHHWFIQDLPSRDWIHQSEEGYPAISYRAPVHMDPYGAQSDFERVTHSWFDHHMPDLNQQQPQLANYLIQNSIWWTEVSGQDAFRIDTYAYCDQAFMSEWNRRLLEEYPAIGIFAETWVHGLGIQSWFTTGLRADQHESYLPGVTDYQMYYAIQEALFQEQGWTSGSARLYYTLAQDYLYEDPYRNVLFLDNHDLDRVYGVLGQDMTKFKSAVSLLMTMRGIPMLYYGTELLMVGGGGGGFAEGGRLDFPGGWSREKDKDNKFRERNRSAEEQDAFSFIQNLAQYRKTHAVLQDGQLTQFIPEEGIYVYFRHNGEQTVMVVFNSNEEAATVDTERYQTYLSGYKAGVNIATGESVADLSLLKLPAKGTMVLELR